MPKEKGKDTIPLVGEKVYVTGRRKLHIFSPHRHGPTPIEEYKGAKIRERLGQLAISSKSKDVVEDASKKGFAGNLELLEYFLRLSKEQFKDEVINIAYVKTLLLSGADINFADKYGQTVLHAGARDWNTDVVRFLIDNGADVNQADAYGRTPIFIAASLDYPKMIEFLCKNGANIHAKTYGERQTPFHFAARRSAIKSMKVLLKLGASVSAEDYKGRSPLYVAAELGNPEAVQYLLDIGCPAAVYNNQGYSAMALMVEKMPSIAMEALSQFLSVNTLAETKSFYLTPLEWNPRNPDNEESLKTTLQMIVKYKEMALLQHPVIQRLLQLKLKLYAGFPLTNYMLLNMVYIILWCTLAILTSVEEDAFHFEKQNWWILTLEILTLILTIASAIEQIILARNVHKSDIAWKEGRIKTLREDLRFCHPQWPNEKEVLEAQIERYSSVVGDYYKNVWTYLEWTIFFTAVSWCIGAALDATVHPEPAGLHQAMRILITVVIFLVWLRFLKACRAYRLAGEYIAIFGNVIYALGQFAFLFFLFFVPFVVAFWIFFGGKENASIIARKTPRLANAFRNLNDVVYTVWTLTVVVGFPMTALRNIDKRVAEAYVAVYYLVMSIVLLNLFIALMSNLFSRVYKDAEKYALLEQAKTILLIDGFIGEKKKKKFKEHMQKTCNPLTESLQFRESVKEPVILENIIQRIKSSSQIVIENLSAKSKTKSFFNRAATVNEIKHNISVLEQSVYAMDQSVTTIQKFNVENKKILKILGVGGKTKSPKQR